MRLFWHILPGLGAIALMWLLVVTSDLTLETLRNSFAAITPGHAVAFFGISVSMLALSALKWRLVMVHMPSGDAPPPSGVSAFLYTCFGATLGLVLMPHVAKPMGRALGARFHGGQPAGKSVAASLFEQVFDLVMIVVLAAFGAIVLAPFLTPFILGALVILAVVVTYVLRKPQLMPQRFHIADLTAILRSPLAVRLSTISLTFYLLTALRTWIVAVPVGIALLPADFFASFSLVQLSRFLAVTPMGIGVADWSWASVLALLDLPLALAATFVLINRCLDFISTLLAFGVSIGLSLVVRRA